MNKSSLVFEVIDQTISSSENRLTVGDLCIMAGVSRSGFYAWKKAEPQRIKQEEKDRADFELILDAFKKHDYSKGARSIYMELIHNEPPVIMNLKKIRRLMIKYRLVCQIRKPNPARIAARMMGTEARADNILCREFESYGPRVVLLTDITYLCYSGKHAYLSTILDAFTKQILSYVVSDSLEVDFVLLTVEQLIEEHGISLNAETIIHSDQGSHYTSISFRKLLASRKLRQSMSRRGNCWDNAPQESFFGHMKDHIGARLKECSEFTQVKAVIDDYMDYYNNYRYQWKLAKLSPNEYYKFYTTGIYPLDIAEKPPLPAIKKDRSELGAGTPSSDSTLGAQHPGST